MFRTYCLLVLLTAATTAEAKPDLRGLVASEDGKPVAGATVCIYTAAVRDGYSTMCPSCYVDCAKRTTTDQDGRFEIRDLDPELLFRVLILEEKYEPQFAASVDPMKGALNVVLKTRSELPNNPKRYLLGQVVDSDKKPVAGAMVNPMGCKTASKRWFGSMPNVDPLAITNAQGEFMLTAREDVEAIDLRVEARGLVNQNFTLVPTGVHRAQLAMTEGAYIQGRLLKDGKPLGKVAMGLVQAEPAGILKNLGAYTVGTDEAGRFLFSNIPANEDVAVFGVMESIAPAVVRVNKIKTGPDGKSVDIGDLVVEDGHRVTGKVVLSDGQPVPPGTRLFLGREAARRDSRLVELTTNGEFAFDGVPDESVFIAVGLPGYRLSEANASLEKLNWNKLSGRVDRDISGLTVVLEPGEIPRQSYLKLTPEQQEKFFEDQKNLPTRLLEGAKPEP